MRRRGALGPRRSVRGLLKVPPPSGIYNLPANSGAEVTPAGSRGGCQRKTKATTGSFRWLNVRKKPNEVIINGV